MNATTSRLGLAWIAGIALAYWLNLPWPVIVIAMVPALGALFLYRHTPGVQVWEALALALIFGPFRLAFFQPIIDENHVAYYNNTPNPVAVTGVVVDEPDIRDNYINLRLRVESLQLNDSADNPKPVSGLILVRAFRYPERFYGDRLTVTGQLETPPVFQDFNYKDYLARFGIHSTIRRPRIDLVAHNQGHAFWTTLYAFKSYASQTINRIMAEPYASLLNGILLGIETGIPRDLYEQFDQTGTFHIFVIYGRNIPLIAKQTWLI